MPSRDPAVFLFDEPLSNLDAKLSVQMRTEIKSLHQRLRTTMVYVTHDQIEAMTMADRITGGRPARTLRPACQPLRRRLHRLALCEPFPRPDHAKPRAPLLPDNESDKLPLSSSAAALPNGCDMTYGIRPEHLELAAAGREDSRARIDMVEPTGSETQVFMRLGTLPCVGVFRERVSHATGEDLRLRVRRDRILLFDRRTGERIAAPGMPAPMAPAMQDV